MITIYEATETNFSTLGLGALAPSSCTVTEELNGQYELDMTHPVDDNGKWERIANDRIIKAPTHDGDQLFRIYNAVKDPLTGEIRVNARHIFYDLRDNLIEDTRPTVKNGQQAGDAILAGCQYSTPFTFSSDITGVSSAYYICVNPVQALIGSIAQSFINRWGGEIRRNNFEISINSRRGSDKGVRIAYGKNLTGIDVTEDISSVYTRIMPTALDADNNVIYTDDKYYDSPLIGNYAHPRIGVLDTGIRVGMEVDGVIPYPDVASAKTAMAAIAQAAFDSGVDKPRLTVDVSFIRWQDTEEYKAYKDLYTLDIGDDVTVEYEPLGLTYKLRVVSVTWDSILDRAESLTLGDLAPNLIKSVASADINLSAIQSDVNGALQEGERYNGVYINHSDGFVTVAEIDGHTIKTKQNSQDGFAIYDGDDFIGGVVIVDGKVVNVSNMLTNDVNGDCYALIGEFSDNGVIHNGIFIYKKSISTTTPIMRLVLNDVGDISIRDSSNRGRLLICSGVDAKGIYFWGENGQQRMALTEGQYAAVEFRTANKTVFYGDENTSVVIYDNNNRIGVDEGGPYYVKNGVKAYF